MALPQLWCSGCNKQIRSGTHYYKESGERLNIKLCKACYEGIPQGEKPEYLPDVELEQETYFQSRFQYTPVPEGQWMDG